MSEFTLITREGTPTIIHKSQPKFKAALEGEDGDWIGRIEWEDDLSDIEKERWKHKALDWYDEYTASQS